MTASKPNTGGKHRTSQGHVRPRTWNETGWPVAIYLRVRGRTEEEVQELVWKFCEKLRHDLGKRFVETESVEVDQ